MVQMDGPDFHLNEPFSTLFSSDGRLWARRVCLCLRGDLLSGHPGLWRHPASWGSRFPVYDGGSEPKEPLQHIPAMHKHRP